MAKDFDVNDDIKRFKFDLEAFVIGNTIERVHIDKDGVEIYLSNNQGIAFRPNGPKDIRIEIVTPIASEGHSTMVS